MWVIKWCTQMPFVHYSFIEWINIQGHWFRLCCLSQHCQVNKKKMFCKEKAWKIYSTPSTSILNYLQNNVNKRRTGDTAFKAHQPDTVFCFPQSDKKSRFLVRLWKPKYFKSVLINNISYQSSSKHQTVIFNSLQSRFRLFQSYKKFSRHMQTV